MTNEERKAHLKAEVAKMAAASIISTQHAELITEEIDAYFANLVGDYDSVALAGRIKARLSSGITTMDLGAGIAIGIVIGVLITR